MGRRSSRAGQRPGRELWRPAAPRQAAARSGARQAVEIEVADAFDVHAILPDPVENLLRRHRVGLGAGLELTEQLRVGPSVPCEDDELRGYLECSPISSRRRGSTGIAITECLRRTTSSGGP